MNSTVNCTLIEFTKIAYAMENAQTLFRIFSWWKKAHNSKGNIAEWGILAERILRGRVLSEKCERITDEMQM